MINNNIKIEHKLIGANNPCFIIAEAGVNHNGDIKLAKKLIDKAVEAKADAVKFQTFKSELLVSKNAKQADYQINNTGTKEKQIDMLKRLELTENDFLELKNYCKLKKIIFLSTPHSDIWSVDVLEKIGVAAYKISSGDLTNIPFLKYVAKKNKPIILPTGMATIKEIKEAKKEIETEGNEQLILLQCTTMYPTPLKKTNLLAMNNIKENTASTFVGFSDHTQGIEAGIISACLGSCVFEKHFTLDNNMKGPDHKASIEPEELKQLIIAIRFVETNKLKDPYKAFDLLNKKQNFNLNKDNIKIILGKEKKSPEPEELEIAKVARKSIIALKEIKKGEELTEKNICVRRPGEGLLPKYFQQIIGRKTNKDLKKENYIQMEYLE